MAPTPTPPPSGSGSTDITDPVIAALINIIATGTSPQVLALQQALLRRMLLEGDVIPSRIPAPRNISEVGGYINLLGTLGQTTVRTEVLASALGVAAPQLVDTILGGSQVSPSVNNPADPAPTTSTTPVMAGLKVLYTPGTTGRVKVTVQATMANATAGDGGTLQLSFGTGKAPTNGDALTGTQAGTVAQSVSPTAKSAFTVAAFAIVTGLTVGTECWFDLAYAAVTGGTLAVSNVTIIIEEF
jgi:hypothetical protein